MEQSERPMPEDCESDDTVLRRPTEGDWSGILAAANAALPQGVREPNEQWLRARRGFDEERLGRRHYVAEDRASGRIVGYGGVEGGSEPGRYRMFVVLEAAQLASGLGERVYQRLMQALEDLDADGAWARELASDTGTLGFFRARGFEERYRYPTPHDGEVVVLKRPLKRE